MNYEDLVQKFDNGELSEQELEILHNLVEEKEDIDSQFVQYEEKIKNLAPKLNSEQMEYLSKVGAGIGAGAIGIGATAAATAVAKGTGLFGIISSTTTMIVGSLVGVGIVTTSMYQYTEQTKQEVAPKAVIEQFSEVPNANDKLIVADDELESIEQTETIDVYIDNAKSPEPKNSAIPTKSEKTETTSKEDPIKLERRTKILNLISLVQNDMKIADSGNDLNLKATLKKRLGVLYRQLGDAYPKSIEILESALSYAMALGDSRLVIDIHGELALSYHKNGQHNYALLNKKRCLELIKQTGMDHTTNWEKSLSDF